ncbi:DUF6694 family lipoprotein [Morganella morganii]|uniref:DUF6694 family lipoprotein n=1 Tax=Morganella morganii TaxID=582 RepID=UPI00052C1163|nr:DUF6694 family lipoprotein [Morganella morganii]KGP42899.1 hypothetical protein LR61_17365 [Morganella morganii]
MIKIFLLLSLFFVTGCEKKVNANSMEDFRESINEIKKGLSDEKYIEFDIAVTRLVASSGDDIEWRGKSNAEIDEQFYKNIKNKFNGKSVDEIIADSNEYAKNVEK